MGASKPKLEDFKEFEDDIDLKSLFKGILIFDEFPVIDDIVMTYRNYQWIRPYIKYLLSPDRDTEKASVEFLSSYDIPGGTRFMRRIIENCVGDEFREIAKKNYELLNFWDDLDKIKTRKKTLVDSALDSIGNRMNQSIPLTIKLFKMELKRLGWDLSKDTNDELRKKFKVLLADFRNVDGTISSIQDLNLKSLKELITKIQNEID